MFGLDGSSFGCCDTCDDKDLEIWGLIEPILDPKAVDSYPHCQEIQQWGGGALRHLAIEIGDNRREVLQDGEVQLTMSRG